ncbi:EC89 protein [Colletotrichum tofieldiae]|nr:EC89 protein [Colletotrichum tofieldiae]GKT81396.1 EC89 protein [Colletotrichum tofieldiae]
MQFFNAIIVLASLAAAAPAAGNAPAVEARQATTNTPCGTRADGSKIEPTWNTGNFGFGDGGWGCTSVNSNGVCNSYFWKTDLPYWSLK